MVLVFPYPIRLWLKEAVSSARTRGRTRHGHFQRQNVAASSKDSIALGHPASKTTMVTENQIGHDTLLQPLSGYALDTTFHISNWRVGSTWPRLPWREVDSGLPGPEPLGLLPRTGV